MRKVKFLLLSLVVLISFTSCKNQRKVSRTDTPTSGIVEIAVDESFAPIIDEQIGVFESLYEKSSIIPIYTNDVNVYDLLMKDSVRLVLGTRELTQNEISRVEAKKQRLRVLKVAVDGVALIIHKDNPDSLLTLSQVQKVITGKIESWKEINANSPLNEISVLFDTPNSSTVRFLRDSVCNNEPMGSNVKAVSADIESVDISQVKSNRMVIEYVASHPNAIGVLGVGWLSNPSDQSNLSFIDEVTVVGISRRDVATSSNSYKPYQYQMALEIAHRYSPLENLESGYPLTRDIYIMSTDAIGGLTTGLYNFIASDRGQRIILKSGLLPANRPIRLINISESMD